MTLKKLDIAQIETSSCFLILFSVLTSYSEEALSCGSAPGRLDKPYLSGHTLLCMSCKLKREEKYYSCHKIGPDVQLYSHECKHSTNVTGSMK